MPNGCASMANTVKLLLKARPTAAQLTDRLRAPAPDGLELYLDTVDLATDAAMDDSVRALEEAGLLSDFVLLVEGPVRSLDGSFFETTRNSDADRELVRRLVALGSRIGARAINLHLILPRLELAELTLARREQALRACLPFTRYFVEQVGAAGIAASLENMPPILRMRESRFYYSSIGMPAEDLAWLAEQVPGLRLCLDVSHAQLYVNACALAQRPTLPRRYARFLAFVRQLPQAASVRQYAADLGEALITCHVANASGMLGEGRSYARGDLDIDAVAPYLATRARYFVTETLERRQDRATLMRDALRRLRRALGRSVGPG